MEYNLREVPRTNYKDLADVKLPRTQPRTMESTAVDKKAEEWLCVEQSLELFSAIRGRGGASNACFHS